MIYYKYRAQDEAGKTITGVMQAQDELDLHERLKQDKKYLIQAKAQSDKKNIKRLKSNLDTADVPKSTAVEIKTGGTSVKADKTSHASYTVYGVKYTEGDKTIYYVYNAGTGAASWDATADEYAALTGTTITIK